MEKVKKTPLYDVHVNMGGRMVSFAGWLMPVQYSGIIEEHNCVRKSAGIFDLSHMGEIFVSGVKSVEYLQKLITNDIEKLADGRALYTVMCLESGGIVDDLLVYRIKKDEYMLVVNALNTAKVFAWMRKNLVSGVEIANKSEGTALIAIQGPLSKTIVLSLDFKNPVSIKYFEFMSNNINGIDCILARTGYTGEDGFEIFFPSDYAAVLWDSIFAEAKDTGLMPVGLGARDTLRMEMGYSLYGNDITEETTPLEAGLSWVIDFNKEFIGKEALLKQKEHGLKRKLIGFMMLDRGIPRSHYEIFSSGEKVGEVTSGTMSSTLKKAIGMGYVPVELAKPGTRIDISIRKAMVEARVVKKPFYIPEKRKN